MIIKKVCSQYLAWSIIEAAKSVHAVWVLITYALSHSFKILACAEKIADLKAFESSVCSDKIVCFPRPI